MVVAYQRSVGTTFVSILHRFRYITTFAYVTVTLRSISVLIRQLKLQVTFSFPFACKYIVNNTCHIFRNIRLRQVLNSWNDLQSHSRTLMTEDRKSYIGIKWYAAPLSPWKALWDSDFALRRRKKSSMFLFFVYKKALSSRFWSVWL